MLHEILALAVKNGRDISSFGLDSTIAQLTRISTHHDQGIISSMDLFYSYEILDDWQSFFLQVLIISGFFIVADAASYFSRSSPIHYPAVNLK